jgi:CHAT domain-containing protein
MDFKSVLDFFDGSIFSEEYLGDFSKIRAFLDSEVDKAGDLTNLEDIAWLKLRQSTFFMLTGNLKRAFDYLQGISQIEGLPINWSIRIAAYKAFYTSLRLYPALIRFKPSLVGPTGCFRTLELGFEELSTGFAKTFDDNLKKDVSFFRFEAEIVILLLTASLWLWNNAYIHHPQYSRGPWEARKKESTQNLFNRVTLLKAKARHAMQVNMRQLPKYLLRLHAELEFGKSPEPSEVVEKLKNHYRTSVDKHNLALLKMLEADHILSPPFSNPIALNLMLIEGNQPGSSIGPWDSIEDQLKLGDAELAGQLYRQAYDFFSDTGSPRGQAAVRLRQGCVQHMQALAAHISPVEQSQRYGLARQYFEESLRLFGLDEANSQIVHGHQILLAVTSKIDGNLLEQAREIGIWGRTASNEAISQFVGILMQRFGRRQMLDHSRHSVALKCYKCAQACFDGLNDRFGLFRALTSELYLYDSMNDHIATRSVLDEEKAMFEEVLELLGSMAKRYPSSVSNCDTLRRDMILVSGNLILSAYNSVGDIKAHDTWKKNLLDLRGGNLGAEFWNYQWSDKRVDEYLSSEMSTDDSTVILSNLPTFSTGDEEKRSILFLILLSISRFFLGGETFKPPISFSEYIKQGQECVEKYCDATNNWSSELQNLNVDAAESHLRTYVQETAPGNVLIHPECFFAVFAAAQVGDFETGRQILSRMVNPRFLEIHGKQEPKPLKTGQELVQGSFVLENVIAACVMSQDWNIGRRVLAKIKILYPNVLDISSASMSPSLWKRLAKVGTIYEHSSAPLEAYAALLKASQLAEQDRSFAVDANSRRGIFDSNPFGDIFTGLARLCLRANELNIPLNVIDGFSHHHLQAKSWQEHALLFLEQAKARNLLDALAAFPSDLGYSSDTNFQTLCSIRPRDLYKAIGDDEFVIEIDYSLYGSTILGITSNGIEFIEQRSKRGLEMRRSVIKAMKHFDKHENKDDDEDDDEDDADLGVSVEVYLQEISQELIEPLRHLILSKKHIIFIASQPLAAFPFSTLLLDGKPLFLHAAVSQAPSLSTLYYLWKSKNDDSISRRPGNIDAAPPITVCTIAKSTVVDPKVKNQLWKERDLLHLAAIEAMFIARKFNSWPLEGAQIDRERLQRLIRNGDLSNSQDKNDIDKSRPTRILHIGAHGDYDTNQPWLSHISLKEDFRVLDIGAHISQSHDEQRENRKTALIVFAACLSGMGRSTMGSDVLGFAHALLQRDCSAYLGALWHVDDRPSMLLMVFFYQHLWECTRLDALKLLAPSEARIAGLWRNAQNDLYNLTKESAREVISHLIEVLETAEQEGYNPRLFVKNWRRKLEGLSKNIESGELDFKDPCHWGAYVVVGYGGMRFNFPN